jgi:hypothetical protein
MASAWVTTGARGVDGTTAVAVAVTVGTLVLVPVASEPAPPQPAAEPTQKTASAKLMRRGTVGKIVLILCKRKGPRRVMARSSLRVAAAVGEHPDAPSAEAAPRVPERRSSFVCRCSADGWLLFVRAQCMTAVRRPTADSVSSENTVERDAQAGRLSACDDGVSTQCRHLDPRRER